MTTERDSARIGITPRWIKILGRREPFVMKAGDFGSRSLISTTFEGAPRSAEMRVSETESCSITDRPRWSSVERKQRNSETQMDDPLPVEFGGEEMHELGAGGEMEPDRPEFRGCLDGGYGSYEPNGEPDHDPEYLSDSGFLQLNEQA